MPASEAEDPGDQADRIVRRCLTVIEEKLDDSGDEPDPLTLAQIAKAINGIRTRPAPKSTADMSYEALVEKARQYPELMEALNAGRNDD